MKRISFWLLATCCLIPAGASYAQAANNEDSDSLNAQYSANSASAFSAASNNYALTGMPSDVAASTQSNNFSNFFSILRQLGSSYLGGSFDQSTVPQWLARTDLNFDWQNNQYPTSAIETIQPLFMDDLNTLFWQGRVAYSGSDETYNLGVGMRRMLSSKHWMWGVNTFLDRTQKYGHERMGLGGELFGQYLTFRANYYDALSGQKNAGTDSLGDTLYERALSGYDYSVEAPIPYLPWARLSLMSYYWKGHQESDIRGESLSTRLFPSHTAEIDFGVQHDNFYKTEGFVSATLQFGAPAAIQYAANTTFRSNEAFAPLDLEKLRLTKVIRQNDIVVEKTHAGLSGGGVVITRGN